jgi:hypothetical protein
MEIIKNPCWYGLLAGIFIAPGPVGNNDARLASSRILTTTQRNPGTIKCRDPERAQHFSLFIVSVSSW